MTDKIPKLRVSRAVTSERIKKQMDKGKELLETQIHSEQEFDTFKTETNKWLDYSKTLFETSFDISPLPFWHGLMYSSGAWQSSLEGISCYWADISRCINDLESLYERLELYEELPNNTQQTMNNDAVSNENKKIFIGHGGSDIWLRLKNFLENTLELPYEEFNRIPQAGKTTTDRLKKMLESCCIAFLIMTGEDEHTDGTLHARENVIHEIGLFQAQLGFERTIILLEKGCEIFSNIHGITYIPFPKGNIEAAFEKIRDVLKRESIT